MKILILFFVSLFLLNSCKKETPTPETKNLPEDTIKLLADEIPVDSLGNFDLKKVPTDNPNILYDLTLANYLNYNKEYQTGFDTQKMYNCDYLFVSNGDTVFNRFDLIFEPNTESTIVETYDLQLKLSNFNYIDPFGDPSYRGTGINLIQERNFVVEKNIFKVTQKEGNTTVKYKVICIQKNEDYLKVIIDDKYLIKLVLNRKFYYNYENCLKKINFARSEKYIFNSSITTKDFTGAIVKEYYF